MSKTLNVPTPKHQQKAIAYIHDRLEDGTIRKAIERTYPLSEIVKAYPYCDTRSKVCTRASVCDVVQVKLDHKYHLVKRSTEKMSETQPRIASIWDLDKTIIAEASILVKI